MIPADRQLSSTLSRHQPVTLKPFGKLEREALQRGIAVLDLNDPDLNPYLREGARKYVEDRLMKDRLR